MQSHHIGKLLIWNITPRQRMKQAVSLATKSRLFMERFVALHALMLAA
jgi:hypothetical protein